MKTLLLSLLLIAPLVGLAQPTPPTELKPQHDAARVASDKLLTDAYAQIAKLKTDLAAAQQLAANAAALQQQVNTLTAQLATANATVTTRTQERDTARQERDAARAAAKQATTTLAPHVSVITGSLPALAVKLSGSEDTAPTFLARWQTFAGALPDFAVWFLSNEGWDTATSQFGACSYHLPRAAKLGIPIIFSLGLGPSPPGVGTASLDSIIAGTRDAVFRRELRALNGFRPADAKVYVRLGWECNGDWYWWSNDATKYKSAFRRVVGIARSEAPRVAIVWCVNVASADIVAWYPGNDVVDVISFDHYPKEQGAGSRGQAEFERARDHATAGFNRIADFARANGKPLAIDEWGALPDSGPWVDLFAAWIREQSPPLLWHGYWDNGPETISNGVSGTTGEAWLRHFRSS